MDLHPVIVLISVTVGGGLFGLVGAFLAVPVAAMIAVAYRYVLDMLRIHSGERTAEELDFVTPEGLTIAKIAEEESAHEREEWHKERDWSAAPVIDEVRQPSERAAKTTGVNQGLNPSLKKLREQSAKLRRLGVKRNR